MGGETFEPVTPGDLCRGSNTHTTAKNYNRGRKSFGEIAIHNMTFGSNFFLL